MRPCVCMCVVVWLCDCECRYIAEEAAWMQRETQKN